MHIQMDHAMLKQHLILVGSGRDVAIVKVLVCSISILQNYIDFEVLYFYGVPTLQEMCCIFTDQRR